MNFRIIIIFSCVAYVNCIEQLISTDLEKCLRCICFATTFCNFLPNCAKAHITQDYWEEAGSPTLASEKPSTEAYRKCIKDTDCILATMASYTTRKGLQEDTNCDEKFDCKDRLAIHFNGLLTKNYSLENYQKRRFEMCAEEQEINVDPDWSTCDTNEISAEIP